MNNGGSVEHNQNVGLKDSLPTNTWRCVVAAEPVLRRPPQLFQGYTKERGPASFKMSPAKMPRNRFSDPKTVLLDSAPSDRHYQLMRDALYASQWQPLANSLQIHNFNDKVLD